MYLENKSIIKIMKSTWCRNKVWREVYSNCQQCLYIVLWPFISDIFFIKLYM